MKVNGQQMRDMTVANDILLHGAVKKLVQNEYAYIVKGLPDDLFDEIIGSGINKARVYGLTAAENIGAFVLLLFEFGPEFHRHPKILPQLTDAAIEPNARFANMIADTPDQVWEQIQSVLHKQTWFPETVKSSGG